MTKDEFSEKLAKKCDLSKTQAAEIIDAIFSTRAKEGIIAIELDAGREFGLVGFGAFRTRKTKARTFSIRAPKATRIPISRARWPTE